MIWISDATECVDVPRVETLDHRFEPAQQKVEVERGRRPAGRDRRAGRQHGGRSGSVHQFEVPVSNEVQVPDVCVGSTREHQIPIDVEGHGDRLVRLQRDLLDGPDPHAGEADRLSRLEAGNVGEHRGIAHGRPRPILAEDEEQAPGQYQHETHEDAELRCDASLLVHPGMPIWALLRGGPGIEPNNSCLRPSEFNTMPGLLYFHGLAPTSVTTNGAIC